MQFVGLLLIVNTLVSGAWWIASGRSQVAVAPLCIAALAAGVFLMRQNRAKEVAPNQSAMLAELAKETATAKTLLADLQDQTAVADWHLKQLDEHLKAMQILPDGRTKIGTMVTGQATILIPKLEELQKLAVERPTEAYSLAAECVSIHEATRDQITNAKFTAGDLGPETIAWLYATAATAAQRTGEPDTALKWARIAVKERPTTERQFLLVTALINKNLQAEANEVIQRQLKTEGAEAGKFRQLLDEYKIPYKRKK